MKIPFGLPSINEQERKLVYKVLSQPILAHGKQTKKFEENFKKFTKANYSHAVSSCTAGMHLFYLAVGLKKNDEVIMPSQTHVATAHAIEAVGAKPVFVDVNKDDGNIDVSKIEKKINKRTKVITVVHFAGVPADMKPIIRIAKKYKLLILEDCALSLGAKINGTHTGLLGDAGVFSFYPVKHITTGEGGMLISKNNKLYKKISLLKSLGINKNFQDRKTPGLYDCSAFGLNYRMSEINSAIGIKQLSKLKFIIKKRKENFNFYRIYLKNNNELKLLNYTSEKNKSSSNYCAIIVLKNKKLYSKRSKIIKSLNQYGIGTSIYYPRPVPYMTYYKKKYKNYKLNFFQSEIISSRSIALPTGVHVNKKKIKYIINKLNFIISNILNK